MIITMEDGSTEDVTVKYTGDIMWMGNRIGRMDRYDKRHWCATRGMCEFEANSRHDAVRLLIKFLKEMGA